MYEIFEVVNENQSSARGFFFLTYLRWTGEQFSIERDAHKRRQELGPQFGCCEVRF
jgi:hypothetical protein